MKYSWKLTRSNRPGEVGVGTIREIEDSLTKLDLPGAMPLAWIVEDMETGQDEDGLASHKHDAPPPNDWHLTWTRLV